MMTVRELSRQANVTPDAIRHYVRIGLLTPERNRRNQYRLFPAGQVKIVKFIRQAKSLGFTLNEIGEILAHAKQGRSPCPTVRALIETHIDRNRRVLAEVQALQTRMEGALAKWKTMPDGVPDGDAICKLIESVM